MSRHEFEPLLQGSLDDTLSADERAELARLLSESPEARDRAAELTELAALIASLGPADAPLGLAADVRAQISHHSHVVRSSTRQRGVAVNKKILFGLAAAAAIVLAVITYYSNPPATVGTEATIGAAQRAQSPQINPSDVKLGDTATQEFLQTETFDAIMKDDTLRTMLLDAELRVQLRRFEMRTALQDEQLRIALRHPDLIQRLREPALVRALDDPAAAKKYASDANLKALLASRAFVEALRVPAFRDVLLRPNYAAALASDQMLRALKDPRFDAAIRSQELANRLAARQ